MFPIIQIARGGIRVFVGFDIVNRSPEEVISKIEIPKYDLDIEKVMNLFFIP